MKKIFTYGFAQNVMLLIVTGVIVNLGVDYIQRKLDIKT